MILRIGNDFICVRNLFACPRIYLWSSACFFIVLVFAVNKSTHSSRNATGNSKTSKSSTDFSHCKLIQPFNAVCQRRNHAGYSTADRTDCHSKHTCLHCRISCGFPPLFVLFVSLSYDITQNANAHRQIAKSRNHGVCTFNSFGLCTIQTYLCFFVSQHLFRIFQQCRSLFIGSRHNSI